MVDLDRSGSVSSPLDDLLIRTPCPMDWERMEGDERQRFCSRCQRHVYNLAELTRDEALKLVSDPNERVCGRIYRRPDGTVVTKECPVPGKKAFGRRFQFSIATLLALLTSSAALFASAPWIGRKLEPIVQRWFAKPTPNPVNMTMTVTMGDVMICDTAADPQLMERIDDLLQNHPQVSDDSDQVQLWDIDEELADFR